MISHHMDSCKLKVNKLTLDKKEDSFGKGSVTLHVMNVDTCPENHPEQIFLLKTGPPLDDFAPYLGISEQELHRLHSKPRADYTDVYEDLPVDIYHRPSW